MCRVTAGKGQACEQINAVINAGLHCTFDMSGHLQCSHRNRADVLLPRQQRDADEAVSFDIARVCFFANTACTPP